MTGNATQLYCVSFKHGNTNHKVVVQAPTPDEAHNSAMFLLKERGLEDWKYAGTIDPIRALIVPQTEATIIRVDQSAATA